jgi:hypothetical protein
MGQLNVVHDDVDINLLVSTSRAGRAACKRSVAATDRPVQNRVRQHVSKGTIFISHCKATPTACQLFLNHQTPINHLQHHGFYLPNPHIISHHSFHYTKPPYPHPPHPPITQTDRPNLQPTRKPLSPSLPSAEKNRLHTHVPLILPRAIHSTLAHRRSGLTGRRRELVGRYLKVIPCCDGGIYQSI